MKDNVSVEWLPVGAGGMYVFSRNGVRIQAIAHRQCSNSDEFAIWVARLRQESWWNDTLYREFHRLFREGKTLQ